MIVCHNRRIHSHRVFKDLAKRGKNSIGWFFGFKLHLIINDRGDLLVFKLGVTSRALRLWNQQVTKAKKR